MRSFLVNKQKSFVFCCSKEKKKVADYLQVSMQTLWLLILYLGIIYSINVTALSKENAMKVMYEWKYIDYKYPSKEEKESAIKSGKYNYTKCFPIDVDRWHDKVFVTIIRDEGVPSSLNTISKETGEGGPLLQPYPDWSWANTNNCDNIISVYRVAWDRCNRLWVLDTGVIGNDHKCPAKLLVFDLPTSKLLKRITIPDDIARNSTSGKGLLVTPVVQTFGENCNRIRVYIADVDGYGLIFYDGKTFRRFTSSAFNYDPNATKYTINNESFTLQDGILGMAYSPFTARLYFSPMSSRILASIDTSKLISSHETELNAKVYKHVVKSQTSAKAMSITGTLFYGIASLPAIGCYSERRLLTGRNTDLVAVNSKTLQFTSGLKVHFRNHREELLAMTNRFQKISRGTLDFTENNFRILRGIVRDVIENTHCRPVY